MAVHTDTTRVGQHVFTASASFEAIGTHHHLIVTRPETLGAAISVARDHLAELDAAVSRFRPDSEVSALARQHAGRDATALVSPVFAASLAAALRSARLTDGLVDPTVGGAVIASGYDDDLAVVRARTAGPDGRTTDGRTTDGRTTDSRTEEHAPVVPGWRSVDLDESLRRVRVPAGTVLDLGASAKAWAADAIAARLAASLDGGFLVNLGGDLAVSGELPADGWQVAVEGTAGEVRQVVASHGQAFATSSTGRRTWTHRGGTRHHIVDPRTGRTAPVVWEQVTCAAATAVEANAASTAAVVLGLEAPAWLAARGIPARLDPAGGGAVVTTPGWPRPGASGRSAA
ncbi:FAD:protein FMN transferase [Pedococcus ginsenosidimutans]|uniref:FAD:protein FMN transferase n=1 Tax=Pedococcus ginsenosidimutans TaxID=490570 RepID=A0ABP8YF35_9MICO